MTKRFKASSAGKYLFLTLLSFVSLFPFFWIIVGSTNESVEITKGSLLPGKNFFVNLNNLLSSDLGFANSLVNSAKIAVLTTIFALLISSLAGYGFEIFKTKARERVFTVLLLSMMVPFAALMVPLFRLFAFINSTPLKFMGLNTLIAVIVPSFSTAFLIFFFRQNTKSFPKDILEAARIDGLGELEIFFKIYIPTMKSTYSAAAIITFMGSWNAYIWPLIALQSPEKRTAVLIISTLGSSYNPDYGVIMIAILIATIPTALIFFIMQKQFVQGMLGSVK